MVIRWAITRDGVERGGSISNTVVFGLKWVVCVDHRLKAMAVNDLEKVKSYRREEMKKKHAIQLQQKTQADHTLPPHIVC